MFKKGAFVENKEEIIERLKFENQKLNKAFRDAEVLKKTEELEREIADLGEYFIHHSIENEERVYVLNKRKINKDFWNKPFMAFVNIGSWNSFSSAFAAYEHIQKKDRELHPVKETEGADG